MPVHTVGTMAGAVLDALTADGFDDSDCPLSTNKGLPGQIGQRQGFALPWVSPFVQLS